MQYLLRAVQQIGEMNHGIQSHPIDFARISARKVRPLADLIRGKFADEALDILRYQPQRGARLLEKVLQERPGQCPGSRPEPGQDGAASSSWW